MNPDLQADVTKIRDMITGERGMRQAVFKGNAPKRQAKVAECDAALASLARLEQALADAHQLQRNLQPGLFDSGE